jgi:hypothetical protein
LKKPGIRTSFSVVNTPPDSSFRPKLALGVVLGFLLWSVPDSFAGEREIASVVQRGNFAYVYNAKGSQISTIPAGN